MACITLPDGRRTTRSTGTSDKKEAQRIANHFEDAANVGKVKKLTESRARKTIADIFAMSNQGELASSSIKDYLQSWLKRKELEAGEATHTRYAGVVNQLLQFLGARAGVDITHLNAKEITEFREQLSKRVSPGTVNTTLKILRSALTQAKRDGIIDVNEAERVTLLKIRKTVRRQAFTEDQLRRILKAANDEWRAMILFGLYTGLRIGDIAVLTWRNVDLVQNCISIETAKTGRHQVLPLAQPLLNHISTMADKKNPEAPLFPSAFAARQRSNVGGTLSNQFHKILVNAKIADDRPHINTGIAPSLVTCSEP